jgi:hypothetical protein
VVAVSLFALVPLLTSIATFLFPVETQVKMSSRSFIYFSFNKLDSLNILFHIVQVDRVEAQDFGTQKGLNYT